MPLFQTIAEGWKNNNVYNQSSGNDLDYSYTPQQQQQSQITIPRSVLEQLQRTNPELVNRYAQRVNVVGETDQGVTVSADPQTIREIQQILQQVSQGGDTGRLSPQSFSPQAQSTISIPRHILEYLQRTNPELVNQYAQRVNVVSETDQGVTISADPQTIREIQQILQQAEQEYQTQQRTTQTRTIRIPKDVLERVARYTPELIDRYRDKVNVVSETDQYVEVAGSPEIISEIEALVGQLTKEVQRTEEGKGKIIKPPPQSIPVESWRQGLLQYVTYVRGNELERVLAIPKDLLQQIERINPSLIDKYRNSVVVLGEDENYVYINTDEYTTMDIYRDLQSIGISPSQVAEVEPSMTRVAIPNWLLEKIQRERPDLIEKYKDKVYVVEQPQGSIFSDMVVVSADPTTIQRMLNDLMQYELEAGIKKPGTPTSPTETQLQGRLNIWIPRYLLQQNPQLLEELKQKYNLVESASQPFDQFVILEGDRGNVIQAQVELSKYLGERTTEIPTVTIPYYLGGGEWTEQRTYPQSYQQDQGETQYSSVEDVMRVCIKIGEERKGNEVVYTYNCPPSSLLMLDTSKLPRNCSVRNVEKLYQGKKIEIVCLENIQIIGLEQFPTVIPQSEATYQPQTTSLSEYLQQFAQESTYTSPWTTESPWDTTSPWDTYESVIPSDLSPIGTEITPQPIGETYVPEEVSTTETVEEIQEEITAPDFEIQVTPQSIAPQAVSQPEERKTNWMPLLIGGALLGLLLLKKKPTTEVAYKKPTVRVEKETIGEEKPATTKRGTERRKF